MKKLMLILGFTADLCGIRQAMGQVIHPFTLISLGSQKIPVTLNKMTTLIFPFAIRPAIKVSSEIAAQKVKNVENAIEITALHRNFQSTNLNVYSLDGQLYSFDLEYAEDPPFLSFQVVRTKGRATGLPIPVAFTGLPLDAMTMARDADSLLKAGSFITRSVTNEGVRMRISGIYMRDSLLWITGTLSNRTYIPYKPEYLQVCIEDEKRSGRTATQRINIDPLFVRLPSCIKGEEPIVLGFTPFAVARRRRLVIEVAEKSGGRLLKLVIGYKTLLKARPSERRGV